jgi:purine-binding chemotaxis protein CheW
MHTDSEAAERRQYLSFVLRGGDYAVPIIKVKEILQYDGLTPVPGTPPSIRGVLNIRGSVVPVVDLGLKFGLAETAVTRWTCILVVEAVVGEAVTPIGVIADSVREVMDLSADDVEAPPAFGTGVATDWLAGMGKLDKSFVLLLDIDRALAADEKSLSAALQAVSEETRDASLPAPPATAAEATAP